MGGKIRTPFILRRPVLFLRGLLLNRDKPHLEQLAGVADPEDFVWRILPHAARTFSACIVMLPYRVALASSVAYLYCRILDTCEDLIPDLQERDIALREFGRRLTRDGGLPEAGPRIDPALAQDSRDASHILLVNKCELVDRMFVTLAPKIREIICDLLREMSAGMRWSSQTFADQQGALQSEEQVSRYCYGVLGTTMIFSARLFRMRKSGDTEITDEARSAAVSVGEFLQLANITRDIEKDLRRGIAYHPRLARSVTQDPRDDPALQETVLEVRTAFLDRALALAPCYRSLINELPLGGFSLHRASAVLMLLFTEGYYQRCAARCGRRQAQGRSSAFATILRAFPAFWSERASDRILNRCEQKLLELRREDGA